MKNATSLRVAPARQRGETAKLALWTVLGSETIFFGTLLSAYFYLRAAQPAWPLAGAPFARLIVPLANTLVLSASALTMSWALNGLRAGSTARCSGYRKKSGTSRPTEVK